MRYSKVLEMEATTYTASFKTPESIGSPNSELLYWDESTGRIIAVDQKVIPLYTRVYVDVLGDIKDYGFAIAGDIGSGVRESN